MDQEQIILSVDDSQVGQAVDRSNRKFETIGDTVVRVSDRSKSSIDRLVTSMEKQAATYGKTGVDKLIAQRDELVKRYQNEQRAVDSISSAYDKMIKTEREQVKAYEDAKRAAEAAAKAKKELADAARKAAEEAEKANPAWIKLGLGLKDAFEGRMAYAEVEAGRFVSSLRGVAMGAGLAVSAIAVIASVTFESMKKLGELGLEMNNLHLRTGIAVKDIEQFSYAAKVSGAEGSIFERIMRSLSQASEEGSKQGEKVVETLKKLGVSLRDVYTGDLRPTSDVLLELADRLNKLPLGFQKDAAYIDLFKRAGIEAIPVMQHLRENIEAANSIGLGVTEGDLQRWDKFHEIVSKSEAVFGLILRHLEDLAASSLLRGILGLGEMDNLEQQIYAKNHPAGETPKRVLTLSEMSKAGLRQDADAYIKSIGDSKSPEQKLRDAEAALSKLSKPELGVTSMEDAQAYKAAEDKVDQIKRQIEAVKELKAEEQKLKSFENSMSEKALSPVERLYAQRDALGFKPGSANYSSATGSANTAAERELEAQEKKANEERVKIFQKGQEEVDKHSAEAWKEVFKEDEARLKMVAKDALDRIKAAQETLKEQDKYRIEAMTLDVTHFGKMSEIANKKEGFGGEIGGLEQEMAIRKAIREQELAIKQDHKTIYDMDKERGKNEIENLKDRYELEEKILEVKKKEFDEVQKSTEKLVNTLLTKPSQFGKELGSTLHDAILKPITEGISKTIAGVVTPIVFGQDGKSGVSGTLRGVFGSGKTDPLKTSTDVNNVVTQQNSAVIVRLIAAMSGTSVAGRALSMPASGGGLNLGSFGDSSTNISWPFGGSGGPSPDSSATTINWPFGGGGGDSSTTIPWNGGGGSLGQESLGIPSGLGGSSGGFGNIFGSLGGLAKLGNIGGGGGLKGILGSLKGLGGSLGGLTRNATGGITGASGMLGGGLMLGGGMLLENGLLGSNRGTGKGVFEGALGGAALGFKFGGPIGAAIGAGLGLAAGLGEMFAGVESPENKAKRLVKQVYGLSIDSQMAKQIVQLSKEKYGGQVDLAVRDPEIRKTLELYAFGTGQGSKFPVSATTPRGSSLSESGGKLYQNASYLYGNPYTFQSSLPAAGGISGGQWPSPTNISLNINGQSAADLLEGRIATTVNPALVQNRYSQALNSSQGRLSNSAAIQQPGLITS